MGIRDSANRIKNNVAAAYAAASELGAEIPAAANSDNLAGTLVAFGAELGENLNDQDTLIEQIMTALEGKAAGGGGITPTGTINITENGSHDVTQYAQADVSVPVGVFPSGTLNITENGTHNVRNYESVSVSVEGAGGGITKTEEAKILAGTYAKTVLIGNYRNDEATVIGDNVYQNATELTGAYFPNVLSVGEYAFAGCTALNEIDLSSVETLGAYAFNGTGMTRMVIPAITIGTYAFGSITKTTNLILPGLSTIPQNLARQSSGIVSVDLGVCTNINTYAFYNDSNLQTFIIRTPTVCTLAGTNAFTNTRIARGTGYIYVPSALVDTYKVATNWSTYANQFRAIEDYPDICG